MGHAELEPEDIDESISALYGAVKRTWIAFCATTSIHGLKYTRDEDTNRIIRLIWMLTTLVMFICAITMVFTFYVDYRSNPTRMNVENDHAPVSSLLFPSITICPEVPFNMAKSEEYIKTLKLPPNAQHQQVLNGLGLNTGFLFDDERFSASEIQLMQNVLELNNLTLMQFLSGVRWSCDELLFRCRYRWQTVDCSELFQVARAFYGYCCSFNINQTGIKFTQQYARAGQRDGLSFIVRYKDNVFKQLRSYSRGFKLMLHEHVAFPSAHAVAKFVPLNEEVFVTVRPTETFCSGAVKSLSIEERQCVFPDEFPLRYFKSYVGGNCELNCRVANMVKFCGCLTFFFVNNRTTDRICEFTDIPCLVESFADIIGRFRNTQCPCPNSCERMEYDVQLTSAKLQLDVPTVDVFYDGIQKEYSVVHIIINSQVYRRVRRDLLSNMVTLVSNLGSAFSLFVGMSMVSAVEIIYYFTVILRKYYMQEMKARVKLSISKKAKVVLETEKLDSDHKTSNDHSI